MFVSEPGGSVRLAFEAPEPNVTAISVTGDGVVVCGTSPGAKVYRIDPYFIYYPMAGFSGQIAYPSVAEVYLDGYLVGIVDNFDGTFQRKWVYYLAGCEACFATGYLGDLQMVMVKSEIGY